MTRDNTCSPTSSACSVKDGLFVPVEKREETDATTWFADATVREVKTDKFTAEEDRIVVQLRV